MNRKLRQGGAKITLVVILICVFVSGSLGVMGLVYLRAKARAIDCANRLRQVAIAAHTFHDTYKRLPPGTLGFSDVTAEEKWLDAKSEFYWQRTQYTSSLAMTMPFNEMNNTHSLVHPNAFNMYEFLDEFTEHPEWFGDVEGVDQAVIVKSENFLCPSDNINRGDMETIVMIQPVTKGSPDSVDYAVKYASEFADKWNVSQPLGRTNYLGSAGAYSGGRYRSNSGELYRRYYVGPMSFRSRVTLESIRDGSKHTIMYGETVGGIVNGKRKVAQSWFQGAVGRGRGDVPWDSDATAESGPFFGDLKNASEFGFGSGHRRGVNFAKADCSIIMLPRNMDRQALYALFGTNDGEQFESKKFISR